MFFMHRVGSLHSQQTCRMGSETAWVPLCYIVTDPYPFSKNHGPVEVGMSKKDQNRFLASLETIIPNYLKRGTVDDSNPAGMYKTCKSSYQIMGQYNLHIHWCPSIWPSTVKIATRVQGNSLFCGLGIHHSLAEMMTKDWLVVVSLRKSQCARKSKYYCIWFQGTRSFLPRRKSTMNSCSLPRKL